MDEILLLEQQLQQRYQQMLIIEQKKTAFLDPRNIPPDLEKIEENLKAEVEKLIAQIERLKQAQAHYQQYQRESNAITLPIVVAAMNRNEADAISKGILFPPESEELREFQEFCSIFDSYRVSLSGSQETDWITHYDKRRDDWKPHASPHTTISQAVEQITRMTNIKRHHASYDFPLVKTEFVSSQFFDKHDRDHRRKLWRSLNQNGCILIVDPISLYHPFVWQTLLQSNLTGSRRVATLIPSPINFGLLPTQVVLEREIDKRLEIAFERFAGELDSLCEFASGDLRSLHRWMYTVLFDAERIVQNKRAPVSNLALLAKATGNSIKQYEHTQWPHLGSRRE